MIKLHTVHSIHLSGSTNELLATYMQHMRNNNLEIRIDVLSSFKSVRNDLVGSRSECVFISFYIGGNFIRVIL